MSKKLLEELKEVLERHDCTITMSAKSRDICLCDSEYRYSYAFKEECSANDLKIMVDSFDCMPVEVLTPIERI